MQVCRLQVLFCFVITLLMSGCIGGLAAWLKITIDECPHLDPLQMQPELTQVAVLNGKKIKLTSILVAPENVAVYSSANKECWLFTGISYETIFSAIELLLSSNYLLANDSLHHSPDLLLDVRLISQTEREKIKGFGNYSMIGNLTMNYRLLDSRTSQTLWERSITSQATVSYGPRATGENPTDRKDGREHKKLFELLMKENLTSLILALREI